METTSCVKAVVSASTLYRNNPSDANLVQLQRQLDVLISITGKSGGSRSIDPSELLVTECLTTLITILRDASTKHSLAEKTLTLFSNLAAVGYIRECLHHTFHLTPCLATYLCRTVQSASDPNALLCARLLQRLCYNAKIHSNESYVAELLTFLIKHIQGKETELLEPCLGLLANLCRQNFSMQNYIKNMDNVKLLYKCLMGFLQCNQTVAIFSLSILASLCIHDDFGETLFNARNINKTFQLMFNILVKGDKAVRKHVVDLFLDLLRYTRVQRSLTIYEHLTSCINQVMLLLCDKDSDSVSKVFEFLLALCSVNDLRCVVCRALMDPSTTAAPVATDDDSGTSSGSLTDPFSAALYWAGNQLTDVAVLALQVLKEVYQEGVDLGMSSSVGMRTDTVLLLLVDLLQITNSACNPSRVARALQLLLVLSSDETLNGEVAQSLDAKMCSALVDWQFTSNPIAVAGWTHGSNGSNKKQSEEVISGVEVLLFTLQLMMQQAKDIPNMNSTLKQTLQDQRVVAFLVAGLTSSSRELVQTTLAAVSWAASLQAFPATVLGDALAAQNARTPISSSPHPSSDTFPVSSLPSSSSSGNPSSKPRPHMSEKELEQSVTCIIDKMQKGLELKDVRASEMISVYEHRLQSLETKESHLQDLLEAKSVALEQADRLIAQYRSRRAHADAEAHKLRSIVQSSERRGEELREQHNELMLERERLLNDVEQLQQDNNRLENVAEDYKELSDNYREQTQKLENVQRSLSTLKQEHQSLAEMHEMLRRHNETLKQQHDTASEQLAELEDERKNLSRQLKEKETKASELGKSLKKMEDRHKKVEKDRDQLNLAIDKLRDDLAKTETHKKELLHQVSSLELVCRQHEASLREKEDMIKNQKTDIEKHAQVATLIRNLTSGMSPGDMASFAK